MAACPSCGAKMSFFAPRCDDCLQKQEVAASVANQARLDAVAAFQAALIPASMTSTTFDLSGYRVTATLGVCRGISVRSRGLAGNFVAGVEATFGGEIMALAKLCEEARSEAFLRLLHSATEMGANAIVGLRFDANEVFQGITEMLAYGTAVQVIAATAEGAAALATP